MNIYPPPPPPPPPILSLSCLCDFRLFPQEKHEERETKLKSIDAKIKASQAAKQQGSLFLLVIKLLPSICSFCFVKTRVRSNEKLEIA